MPTMARNDSSPQHESYGVPGVIRSSITSVEKNSSPKTGFSLCMTGLIE